MRRRGQWRGALGGVQAGGLPGNVPALVCEGRHLFAAGGEVDGEPGGSQFLQRERFWAKDAGGNFLSVRAGLGHGGAPQAATGAAGRGFFMRLWCNKRGVVACLWAVVIFAGGEDAGA